MDKKRLPIGISDFKEIVEKDYYFVDKTLMIEELIATGSKITLLPRPRRFGKTLNMSMLRYFFDIKNAEKNKKFFEGLKITESKYMKEQGQYPVIYLSFKDVKELKWENCFKQMQFIISELYKSYSNTKEKLDSNSLQEFNEIIAKKADEVTMKNSILLLSKHLKEYYGKKVVILIDEYDTPLTIAHMNGYYEEAISFFRNLLSAAFKDNEYLEIGVLTGIMRIAKESIFSGLNNLEVSTILDDSYQHFGLREEEVEELVKYYGLDYEMGEVKKWYNGYKFGNTQVYNPWSIINFAKNNELKPYWVNTSSNDLIRDILKENDEKIIEELEKLFKGESISQHLSDGVVFSDLKNTSTIWALLFFTGYLTYESYSADNLLGEPKYNLIIPNNEVRSFFKKVFIEIHSNGNLTQYSNMVENLYYGEIEKFGKEFKKLYKMSVSYHDKPTDKKENEKYYHNFMLGMLLTLSGKYIIKSNREAGYGRYDIALFPREKEEHGMIFEFKIAETKDILKDKIQEAINQIEENEYTLEMKADGVEKIFKIGIAFCGKDVEVGWKL